MSDASKGIVLVADDAPDSLGMLNSALTNEGYTVLVAMDGVQALSIASKMAPDIILLDAIMPNLDGFSACLQLKNNAELSDVPVIFMTGLSDSEHVVKGLESGGVDYISKPIQFDELFARIRVHLNNSRITRSARGALNEIGQLAFACNLSGEILWLTAGAKELLTSVNQDSQWMKEFLPVQINQWLSRSPKKNSFMSLRKTDQTLQVRYLGQISPGEYLLRLVEDNELQDRQTLRKEFFLTEREAEVLLWLSRGKANREIAQILSMSPRTVNKHLEQVFRKLGVENRTTAASICLQRLNDS